MWLADVTNLISVGSLWVLCGIIHGYTASTIHYQQCFFDDFEYARG